MYFSLFGFDWYPKYKQVGIWLGSIGIKNRVRSLFYFYYNDGWWTLDLFYTGIRPKEVIGRLIKEFKKVSVKYIKDFSKGYFV